MSRLYAMIHESDRKTMPTARGTRTIGARVSNFKFAVSVRLLDRGGLDNDIVEVTIQDIETGESFTLRRDALGDVFTEALDAHTRRLEELEDAMIELGIESNNRRFELAAEVAMELGIEPDNIG